MGEFARKPGAPELPKTPEELLTAGPGQGYSWAEKNLGAIVLGITLGCSPGVYNWKHSRPVFAGIYRHIIFGAIGYAVGSWLTKIKLAQRAEKDAILLHYISLHPEEFPPIERQRYKDLFLSWTPKR